MSKKIIIDTEIELGGDIDYFTEEEQVDQCCKVVDWTREPCVDMGKTSEFTSLEMADWKFDPDVLAAPYAQQYGNRFLGVDLVPNGPPHHCGVKEETWEGRLNCCDEVDELAIDTDASVSVLEPGTHGNVYFTGGRFPVRVSVRGNGFTLDGHSQRDGWIDGPLRAFTIYAHEFACGTAPITLDDGCTVAKGSVRCTVGRWDGYCQAYYLPTPAWTYYTTAGLIFDGVYGCVPQTHLEYFAKTACYAPYVLVFRWVDGWWGQIGSVTSLMPIGQYSAMIAALDALGGPWPRNQYPRQYAPNGPGDVQPCSHPQFPCRWIC